MSTDGDNHGAPDPSVAEGIQRARRSRPYSLARGNCQYPGCTETNITARHYGKVHGLQKEKFVTHRSGTKYMGCKTTDCANPHISGNNIHDAITHMLDAHPGVISGESKPVGMPADWQVELDQIAQIGTRFASSTEASIDHLRTCAMQYIQGLLSRIQFFEQQAQLKDGRMAELEERIANLTGQCRDAHSTIMLMHSQAYQLDELDRIYNEYRGIKDT